MHNFKQRRNSDDKISGDLPKFRFGSKLKITLEVEQRMQKYTFTQWVNYHLEAVSHGLFN
jgi:hypothetical protein